MEILVALIVFMLILFVFRISLANKSTKTDNSEMCSYNRYKFTAELEEEIRNRGWNSFRYQSFQSIINYYFILRTNSKIL